MEIILWILGIGAVIGVLVAVFSGENPLEGALQGGCMAGNCLLQLLIPAIMVLIGIWLLAQILG